MSFAHLDNLKKANDEKKNQKKKKKKKKKNRIGTAIEIQPWNDQQQSWSMAGGVVDVKYLTKHCLKSGQPSALILRYKQIN